MLIITSLILWALLFLYDKKCPKLQISWESRGGGGGNTTTVNHTNYYYRIRLPHTAVDPNQSIILYDSFGQVVYVVPPLSPQVNYASGTISVPGNEQNAIVESISTATYYVYYNSSNLVVDYERGEFKISKSLIKTPAATVVRATFEYLTVMTAVKDIASVIDGKWDTQVQTTFTSEPPTNYNYAILDLGASYEIQALDIIAGFFYPDEEHTRKYDIGMTLSLRYSLDGITYYNVSDNAENFEMSGGEGKSFEEDDLGIGFEARYLKLLLQSVNKIDYGALKVTINDANRGYYITQGLIGIGTGNGASLVVSEGLWAVAFTEIAAYNDIINKSTASLIATTYLTTAINISAPPTSINVTSTSGFTSSGTGYILNDDGLTFDTFTYTGLTSTSFTGVTDLSQSHAIRTTTTSIDGMVVQSMETDTTLYDYNCLLPKLGDRVTKIDKISEDYLYTKAQNDYLSKRYLYEFIKNHTKININVMYCPHLKIGQTITVIDPYNITTRNYFIESISEDSGRYSLTLAYYPGS